MVLVEGGGRFGRGWIFTSCGAVAIKGFRRVQYGLCTLLPRAL